MIKIKKDVHIETESKSILSVIEINRVTGTADYSIFQIPTFTAVAKESARSKELELPVITCANVSSSVGVLWLTLGEKNRLYSKDGCVIIEGKTGDDLLKLSDKLVLHLLGVF